MTKKAIDKSDSSENEFLEYTESDTKNSDISVNNSVVYGQQLPVAHFVPLSNGGKIENIQGVELPKQESEKSISKKGKLPKCKYCAIDGVFQYGGENPLYRKGIWKKGKTKVCAKRHSILEQNNKGVWYVCDEEQMQKCHYYEPEE